MWIDTSDTMFKIVFDSFISMVIRYKKLIYCFKKLFITVLIALHENFV